MEISAPLGSVHARVVATCKPIHRCGVSLNRGGAQNLEFERKDKLAAEREMLGLYVSDHPPTSAPQQCTPETVARLKIVLAEHHGVVSVHLRLADGKDTGTTLRLPDDLCVSRTPGLYAELKMLAGPDAVS